MEDDSEDGYFPALWRYEAVATDLPAGSEIAYDDAGLPLDADGSAVFAAGDIPARNADGTLRTGQGDGGTVEFYRALRTQAAAVTLDYDGHVLALVGGVGPKTVDLAYNRATAPHQTGSTMKPLAAYALGIEYGLINFSSPMTDAPLYTAADKRILNTDLVQRLGLPNDPYAAVNLARDDVWRSWPNNYSGTPQRADRDGGQRAGPVAEHHPGAAGQPAWHRPHAGLFAGLAGHFHPGPGKRQRPGAAGAGQPDQRHQPAGTGRRLCGL